MNGVAVTYTGVVTAADPWLTRTLRNVTIRKASVSTMDNNAYLLSDQAGHQILIDAADSPGKLGDLVGHSTVEPKLDWIITTHRHKDHWQALSELAQATGALTAASATDGEQLPVRPDRTVAHGDTVTAGAICLHVIELRGHTPGSIALVYEDSPPLPGAPRFHIFVGDSLFPGGLGKTWSSSDFEQLYADVSDRVFDVYPDETWVYPGHGNDTTLGAERPHLATWKERGW